MLLNKKDICRIADVSYYILRVHLSSKLAEVAGIDKDDFINHRGYFDAEVSNRIKNFFG
jgi:hypothetical protein